MCASKVNTTSFFRNEAILYRYGFQSFAIPN
jgi:hypothetical protein